MKCGGSVIKSCSQERNQGSEPTPKDPGGVTAQRAGDHAWPAEAPVTRASLNMRRFIEDVSSMT
jgi:hypothetical protein